MKYILTILFISGAYILGTQGMEYVSAKNGLNMRSNPDLNSNKTGKLEFGSQVKILERIEIDQSINDSDKFIRGKWVKVENTMETKSGYVLDAYLTSDFDSGNITIKFDGIGVEMTLDIWGKKDLLSEIQKDTAYIYVELGDSPERKMLKIEAYEYSGIELFQMHENSVTIMNEGPHCDLTYWKHDYSNWDKLESKNNWILTDFFSNEDRSRFIDINILELQDEVNKGCEEQWLKLISHIKSVGQYNSAIAISRIYIKIRLKDHNNKESEKFIVFEMPMGC